MVLLTPVVSLMGDTTALDRKCTDEIKVAVPSLTIDCQRVAASVPKKISA